MPHHHESKQLPYQAVQMYDLVADVARYPEFLPWTAAARIRSRSPIAGGGEVMQADLVISFKVFREKFGSRVTLLPAESKILTEYIDGPFKHLKSIWTFKDTPSGCDVSFTVDFEFRNPILAGLIGLVFNEAMTRVVRAFEVRAAKLYAPTKP
ncbi:type II toxin-antitoxin system RatA family toxin [Cypionkella sp.]|uniref:type II toxin-antitoxin system RatA family toxin n=1 Tax=Cypionkella sp. TaxID=2811411 RepID=UPI00271A7092|nr:type II toxin-antitoxin system RatA family toxin [Cypionkella sp.]MDO8985522.1 type II toxin-antitoxin system RatA family toxin [Cypionkella sp.]MDP2048813.1 type II toxin-antitoxin system RatA family toxin [Cypionkella sp.]